MLTAIGEKAFRGYKDLTSVTIPDSVTEISSWAFENCTSLTVKCTPGSYAWKYCRAKGIPLDHPASGKGADTDKACPPRRGVLAGYLAVSKVRSLTERSMRCFSRRRTIPRN